MTTSLATATHDELADYISDAYKDLYGIRPRHIHFSELSEAKLMTIADELTAQIKENQAQTERLECEAVKAYEALIAKSIELGAADRHTAIRWIVQPISNDLDDVMVELNLPIFNQIGRALRAEIISAIS